MLWLIAGGTPSIQTGKAWQQEPKADLHIVFIVRKLRDAG